MTVMTRTPLPALPDRRGRGRHPSVAARRPAGPGAHQARPRPRDRRGAPARLRQLRRAPRALRLRRGLRGEAARCPTRTASASDVMDAARGLGVTLLRWPGGNFASGYNWKDGIGPRDQRPGAARSRLGGAREQPLRDRRVPHLLRAPEGRALPLHQRRPRLRRGRPQLGRVHERVREHLLGAAAAQERPRQAVGRQGLGPRQRDRRPLAARPQERRGLRQVRARGRQGHAPRRRLDQADRLRLVELRPGRRLGGLEPHGARAAQERDRLHLAPHLRRQPDEQLRAVPGLRPGPRRSHRGREGADPGGAGRQPRARARSTSRSTSGTCGIARSSPAAPSTRSRRPASRRTTTSRTRSPWASS